MNILKQVRESKTAKIIAAFIAVNLITQLGFPTVSFALTSGPGQEEFASFEPASTSDMVNLYTGDFNYNIPLFSIPGPNGGYPINLAYHSDVGMEQEASWVGLGWELNVGSINRAVRGLPDDYNYANVVHTMNVKPSTTITLNLPTPGQHWIEQFGVQVPNNNRIPLNTQLYYNNYQGMGYRLSADFMPKDGNSLASVGVHLTYDSQNGLGIEPDLTLKGAVGHVSGSLSIGCQINSRDGMSGLSFTPSLSLARASKYSGYLSENINGEYAETNTKINQHLSARSTLNFAVGQSPGPVTIPMLTNNYQFSVRLPGSCNLFGNFDAKPIEQWSGGYETSEVANNGIITDQAMGYLYTPANSLYTNSASPINTYLEDFNRDNLAYSDQVPYLAPSSFTYDIYNQTGQGTGSMFRPYSSSVHILTDPIRQSKNNDYTINAEFGLGSSGAVQNFHFRLGYVQDNGTYTSGPWQGTGSTNNISPDVAALDMPGTPFSNYEPTYFQVYGEQSATMLSDDYLTQHWGGDEAVRVGLETKDDPSWLNTHFITKDDFEKFGSQVSGSVSTYKSTTGRQARGTNIESFTNMQAAPAPQGLNEGYSANVQFVDMTNSNTITDKDFHTGTLGSGISEMSVLENNGMRYVYGLPTYNNYQMDATFSVSGPSAGDPTKTSVPPNLSPTAANQYLSETEMNTPYANSWLLTQVLSDDYVDRTGNGPSDDDYGYWVKFTYAKVAENYQWRVPYENANYSAGLKNDPNTYTGSMTYGKKELYYIKAIETKTHIAIFSISPRTDGLGANDLLTGGQGGNSGVMYKLDKISLYTKAQYGTLANPKPNPVPIKEVHFGYNYDLCQGAPNSGSGNSSNGFTNAKLTLENLYFTYQNSTRGQFSPYTFQYDFTNTGGKFYGNPSYKDSFVDRWGNYKDNSYYGPNYPYYDFPYTDQYYLHSAPTGQTYADAWQLTGITLPTGGQINVNYELKDYAYVENNKATAMFDIEGFGALPQAYDPNIQTDRSYPGTPVSMEQKDVNGDYPIWFRLETPQPSWTGSDIYQHYLDNGNIHTAYYKVYNDLLGHGGLLPAMFNPEADYVSGYADVVQSPTACGVDGTGTFGYITLKSVPLSKVNIYGININPMTRASIEHLRADRPELLYTTVPYSNSPLAQVLNFIGSIPAVVGELLQSLTGFNFYATQIKSYGELSYLGGRSIIRLAEPTGHKFGGGSRVQQLTLKDNWVNVSANDGYDYGQTYSYNLPDGTSSGVAYEPQIGGEESALTGPVAYTQSSSVFSANYHRFVENPVLKSYYPGASVGYSKVTVTSIGRTKAETESHGANLLSRSAAPVSVYEFYTPKDFPVITDATDLSDDDPLTRTIFIPGIYTLLRKRKCRSQGYSVILNDMAGKQKQVTTYTNPVSGPGTILSQQTFNYQTVNPYNPNNVNELSSQVQVMSFDNNTQKPVYQTALVGQSSDVFMDMNENCQSTSGGGGDLDLDLTLLPVIPFILFWICPFPSISYDEASLRTVTTNKVIYRSGILQSVVTTTDQSKVTQTNLAFDPQTGQPLLTSTTNEFDDPIYNFSYPAYWFYPGMGGAYQNFGFAANVGSLSASGGYINTTPLQAGNYLTPGDQVLLKFTDNSFGTYTVTQGGGSFVQFIDAGGNLLNTSSANVASFQVIKSGYKNLQSLKAGTLVAKNVTSSYMVNGSNDFFPVIPTNTLTVVNSPQSITFDSLIDAKAVKYADQWPTLCDQVPNAPPGPCNQTGQIVNPYLMGLFGIWRPSASFAYVTSRKTPLHNVRFDGTYSGFTPFNWFPFALLPPNWVLANTITKYSPYGFELENQNAIGVYSAAIYGYGNTLVTGVASNAQFGDIGFESFEDESSPLLCDDNHFRFDFAGTGSLVTTQSHTGKYSLQVNQGAAASMTKYFLNSPNQNCGVDIIYPYSFAPCNCLGEFAPNSTTSQYVISAWVYEHEVSNLLPLNDLAEYKSPQIEIDFYDGSNILIPSATRHLVATGNIIEGWQRIYDTYTVPLNAASMTILLQNNSTANSPSVVCFDDVRSHPFTSNMNTYVYDNSTLKVMAELDPNNYATFYNYDDEGHLTKIKKETIEGIQTIKEGRINNP